MTAPTPQVRRATIEDLPRLVPLWNAHHLTSAFLDKRFKEFQLVVDGNGNILGAVGILVSGTDALLHSEVYEDPARAEELRPLLWERVQSVVKNHGVARLWTQAIGPFWPGQGFQEASLEFAAQRPAAFQGTSQVWSYLQLRDPVAVTTNVDREFALFQQAERETTERLFRRARVLKMIAGVVAAAVLLLVIFWAISFFRLQGRVPQ